MRPNTRFPSLDGWRALSILLVLGNHSTFVVGFPKNWDTVFTWLFDGHLGVRFFFVISGFLITHLLFQEYNQTGNISLRRFYIRRAFRILPVYFAYLLVLFLLQIFTAWRQPAIVWIGNLTFTTNFHQGPWTTAHLWSLAVEEQFYLLWPLLLVFIALKGNKRTVFYILGIPLLVAPIWRVLSYAVTHGINRTALNFGPLGGVISHLKASPLISSFFSDGSFLNYFDSLAVGCIAAILLTRHEQPISAMLKKRKTAAILLGLALVLVPYVLEKLFWGSLLVSILGLPFKDTLQAVGFAILLLQSILSPQVFKPLNWPAVKKLGVLSYSIYIWQMIFCSNPHEFGFPDFWFMSFPGWLLAACLVAALSYYGLEKPLMGLRARFRNAEPKLKGAIEKRL